MVNRNYTAYSTSSPDMWAIVSFLVAICAGIVLFYTFLNPRNEEEYTGTTKRIYDFLSFKTITLESIFKICYLIFAIYITISSFSLISTSFVAFLLVLFLGNVLVRVIFEGGLLLLMIYRKLNEINSKMSSPKETKVKVELKKEDKKSLKDIEK